MAARFATRALFRLQTPRTTLGSARLFSHGAARRVDVAGASPVPIVPVRRPVGAFRGGMLGFFAGCSLAGAAVYYYILDEYRVSNELLTEDIYVRLCI